MTLPRHRPPAGRFDALIASLPGIDLDRMAERASLMTRTDRKYLLPAAVVRDLVTELAEGLQVLDIGERRIFAYRSLYYDTPDLLSYRTAATRRRRRFKVRRREYVDAGTSFLEVKTRTGRGDTEKVRKETPTPSSGALPRPGGAALAGDDAAYVREKLAEAGVEPPHRPLLPTLETAYSRTTLLIGAEGSRMTIDQALVWRGTRQEHLLEDLMVLETKSAAAPGVADRLLWRAHHRPQRISKFATGLALLDPELPANRWHRTLGRLRPHVRQQQAAA